MLQFVFIGRDGPGGLERRKAARPAHLDYWATISANGRLVFAGPLLDNDIPVGSLIIFSAETAAAAEALTHADPYIAAGVFAETELRPTKQVLP